MNTLINTRINTKVTFLLLLVLLIILMLFYYIDLESNIIILLGVVIVLIIHNLITKKEHFNINEQTTRLEAQIDSLTAVAEALKARGNSQNNPVVQNTIAISKSCPFNPTKAEEAGITDLDVVPATMNGVNLGFETSMNQLSASDLRRMFSPTKMV